MMVPEYIPNIVGGGGYVYRNLVENYKKLNHEVIVVYGDYASTGFFDLPTSYVKDDVLFYKLPEFPTPEKLSFLKTVLPINLFGILYLFYIFLKHRPAIAHLHGYGLISINIFAFFCIIFNVPYVFTLHGYPHTQSFYTGVIKIAWDLYVKMIMNPTLYFAKKVVGVSKFITEDERNIKKHSSQTIFNGFRFEDFESINQKFSIREKHKISNDSIICFSIGRIIEMKGFDIFIEKMKTLPSNLYYLIAGDDLGHKEYLLSLIKKHNLEERVIFLGYLNLEEKKNYYSQSDFVVIPSRREPFGLIALEAAYYGKPIIYNPVGGLVEVLEEYDNKIDINKAFDLSISKDIDSKKFIEKFKYFTIAQEYIKIFEQYVR